MKTLMSAFKSAVVAATANVTVAAMQAGKVVATASVAATGVGLHHTSQAAGKAAIAMARGSGKLAAWLYKHAPVQQEAATVVAPATVPPIAATSTPTLSVDVLEF